MMKDGQFVHEEPSVPANPWPARRGYKGECVNFECPAYDLIVPLGSRPVQGPLCEHCHQPLRIYAPARKAA